MFFAKKKIAQRFRSFHWPAANHVRDSLASPDIDRIIPPITRCAVFLNVILMCNVFLPPPLYFVCRGKSLAASHHCASYTGQAPIRRASPPCITCTGSLRLIKSCAHVDHRRSFSHSLGWSFYFWGEGMWYCTDDREWHPPPRCPQLNSFLVYSINQS